METSISRFQVTSLVASEASRSVHVTIFRPDGAIFRYIGILYNLLLFLLLLSLNWPDGIHNTQCDAEVHL
jgi:hypothetical protein